MSLARRRRKPLRDMVARAARGVKAALIVKSFVQNPVMSGAKMVINKAAKLDNYRKIVGPYRNRVQYLNPRTKRWIVKDRKTGRIIRVSKGPKPFKNIRKVLRKNR